MPKWNRISETLKKNHDLKSSYMRIVNSFLNTAIFNRIRPVGNRACTNVLRPKTVLNPNQSVNRDVSAQMA